MDKKGSSTATVHGAVMLDGLLRVFTEERHHRETEGILLYERIARTHDENDFSDGDKLYVADISFEEEVLIDPDRRVELALSSTT